jgi:hypothetical protein
MQRRGCVSRLSPFAGLSHSHPGPLSILVDEDHPYLFEGAANGVNGVERYPTSTALKIDDCRQAKSGHLRKMRLCHFDKCSPRPTLRTRDTFINISC